MTTEQDKDKHVTFRAPEYLINAVALYCRENDEKPSQFWRKAAKLRLEHLQAHSSTKSEQTPTSSARAGARAVASGERKCKDGRHCAVPRAANS